MSIPSPLLNCQCVVYQRVVPPTGLVALYYHMKDSLVKNVALWFVLHTCVHLFKIFVLVKVWDACLNWWCVYLFWVQKIYREHCLLIPCLLSTPFIHLKLSISAFWTCRCSSNDSCTNCCFFNYTNTTNTGLWIFGDWCLSHFFFLMDISSC
jgi:hypothetical protein